MKKSIIIYKPQGLTPLQAIQKLKEQSHEYTNQKISYAGRLDPMAEGLLFLLINEENKNRNAYEDLSKVYTTEIVLGVSTDTYDALGKITNSISPVISQKNKIPHMKIHNIINKLIGKQLQPYPPYSSKPVKGKPLFYWARENKLDQIDIPSKEISIHQINIIQIREITKENLQKEIVRRINNVHGEFRQNEIIKIWNEFFQTTSSKTFPLIQLQIHASSGTYIRSIANTIGEMLQTHAFTLSIKRISIGTYTIENALPLF